MENNIKHYNFESDFKLVDLNVQEGVPFEFRYYVKRSGEVVIASYDGEKYTGCRPSDEVAGAIVVPFDGGKLGIGTLKVKRVYDIVDADMADGVFNSVTEQVLPIELWRGASDDVAGDAVILYDSLYRGKDGKSAYDLWLEQGNEGTVEEFLASLKGEKMTYDELTEEEKNDLASRVELDVPEIPEDILDKMITAEPAEGDSEIKQLKEGDKVVYPLTSTKAIVDEEGKRVSILTEDKVEEMITQSITNVLNTEV